MHLTTRKVEHLTIVTVTGRIDALSADELLASLMTLLSHHSPYIVIDMEQVDYLSSAGMRTFLMSVREADKLQGKIVFANFCTMVAEVLDLAGLSKYFTHFRTLDEAIAELKRK